MNPANTMNARRRMRALIMLIAFGFLFTGCASTAKMPKSGFLTDYSLLKKNEDPRFVDDWIYVKEGVDWKSYDKIMVERVTYFFNEEADYKGIQAEELTQISEIFNEHYIRVLKYNFILVDEPGPNTLRIRTAITGLTPNEPVTGTLTTVIPVGIVVSAGAKATTGSHIGMGGASGEAEILDSQTGEVLAAGIDTTTGSKARIDKSVTKWGQVEEITKMWAENLAENLKRVREEQ